MPWAIRKLLERGYWNEENGGEGGSAGGSPEGDDSDSSNSSSDNLDVGDSDDGDDDVVKVKAKAEKERNSLLRENMKKKAKIKEQEEAIQSLRDDLARFDGIDLDEVKTILAERKTAEAKKLEDKQEWGKLKQQILDEHAKEVGNLKGEIAGLLEKATAQSAIIEELTVGHAFDSSKYISNEMTLTARKARALYGGHFDIEDGRVVGYDKPRGSADRVQLVGGDGEALSFDSAMTKIIDADPDRDTLIRSKAKPGASSRTDSRNPPQLPAEKLKGIDRISAAINSGQIMAMGKPKGK